MCLLLAAGMIKNIYIIIRFPLDSKDQHSNESNNVISVALSSCVCLFPVFPTTFWSEKKSMCVVGQALAKALGIKTEFNEMPPIFRTWAFNITSQKGMKEKRNEPKALFVSINHIP